MSQLIIYNKFKSENYDNRKFNISLIIIHFTETKTFNDALNLLTSKKRKVSCHYLIDRNGDIFNLVWKQKGLGMRVNQCGVIMMILIVDL